MRRDRQQAAARVTWMARVAVVFVSAPLSRGSDEKNMVYIVVVVGFFFASQFSAQKDSGDRVADAPNCAL